ncbi:MAG: hypothetical protein IH989_06110 [Planctomycetes bacterium]|nr:hypothetical protein [Planctomycetota bacterium]
MSTGRGLRCAVLLGALSALPAMTHADINLELRVSSSTVSVGDTVEVGLYAVSDAETDQTFSAVDVILHWDPSVLRLDGKIDNGFGWSSSTFPCDGCLGKLNFDCCCQQTVCDPAYSGLPANDGVALYQAWQFSGPFPEATLGGTLITSIVFAAIGRAAATEIRILDAAGNTSTTRVLNGPAENLTGALGSLLLESTACGTRGDFDGDCRVELFPDHFDFVGCMNGPDGDPLPPDCDPADFNGDGVADMLDAAAFQREFTGP